MNLTILGINHNFAPLAVRERLAHNEQQVAERLACAKQNPNFAEVALLSTCNRTEFYAIEKQADSLRNWFIEQNFQGINMDEHIYQLHDAKAVQHLFRVACGLDSLVLGEPQILGQLKDAYQYAQQSKSIKIGLNSLFEAAFSVAKKVRSQTSIGQDAVSVASTAVRLSHSIFGALNHSQALLIGAGETMEITARHLTEKNIKNIIVANRRIERAKILAQKYQGDGIGLSDIPKALLKADIVISSTASTLPLIGKGMIETALKRRKHQPFFMVDLAVPRDIEPEVGDMDDVYLFTLDDLQRTIAQNQQNRRNAAKDAEAIVHLETVAYMEDMRTLDTRHLLQSLHQNTAKHSQESLQKALSMLENGSSATEALTYLAHNLSKRIIHQPSIQLRNAADEGNQQVLKSAQILFNLHHKKP